jgi:hypothetical protein
MYSRGLAKEALSPESKKSSLGGTHPRRKHSSKGEKHPKCDVRDLRHRHEARVLAEKLGR